MIKRRNKLLLCVLPTIAILFSCNPTADTKFKVTFDTNGGSKIDPQEVKFNGLVTKPTNPTKEGYTFVDWYTENTFKTVYDFNTPVKSSFTLYAKYDTNPTQYTVTFNTNGGTEIPSQTINEGSLVKKPDDPTKIGFLFSCWCTDDTLKTEYDFNTPVTSSFTLYAKYNPVTTYIVTFNSNGGSSVPSQTVNEGTCATMPKIPTKDNSLFEGWYLNDNLFDFTTKITADIELKAHWGNYVEHITSVTPKDGAAYDVRNDDIKDFTDNFEKEYSAKYKSKGDHFKNNPLRLSWTADDTYDSYIVDISTDKTFKTYESYSTVSTSVAIENVYTDTTYYWQVSCYKNCTVSSSGKIYSVHVENAPRLLNVDSITNIRDIGGKRVGNKRVKQGMVYRSARLDDISAKGKQIMKDKLDIKTELELRDSTYTESKIDAKLIAVAFPWWTGSTANGLDNPSYWPAVKTIIESFADTTNYPMDFHCSIGQDRTGTLAILIEGLLGVSLRDIYLDYELTSFSSVTDGDDPVNQSIHNKYQYQVEPLIEYLKTMGESTDSFQTCVINFLKTKIGITDETIQSIQNILLEDK